MYVTKTTVKTAVDLAWWLRRPVSAWSAMPSVLDPTTKSRVVKAAWTRRAQVDRGVRPTGRRRGIVLLDQPEQADRFAEGRSRRRRDASAGLERTAAALRIGAATGEVAVRLRPWRLRHGRPPIALPCASRRPRPLAHSCRRLTYEPLRRRERPTRRRSPSTASATRVSGAPARFDEAAAKASREGADGRPSRPRKRCGDAAAALDQLRPTSGWSG